MTENIIELRSESKALSEQEVQEMLRRRGFAGGGPMMMHEGRKGIDHSYEQNTKNNDKVIIDNSTGLIWAKTTYPSKLKSNKIKQYLEKFNNKRYAGSNDWRLPTLEEACSLVEPEMHDDFYINPIFGNIPKTFWTCDTSIESNKLYYISYFTGWFNSPVFIFFNKHSILPVRKVQ